MDTIQEKPLVERPKFYKSLSNRPLIDRMAGNLSINNQTAHISEYFDLQAKPYTFNADDALPLDTEFAVEYYFKQAYREPPLVYILTRNEGRSSYGYITNGNFGITVTNRKVIVGAVQGTYTKGKVYNLDLS